MPSRSACGVSVFYCLFVFSILLGCESSQGHRSKSRQHDYTMLYQDSLCNDGQWSSVLGGVTDDRTQFSIPYYNGTVHGVVELRSINGQPVAQLRFDRGVLEGVWLLDSARAITMTSHPNNRPSQSLSSAQ
jgi:hypothetical protein